jgi:hypothetical protein
MEQRRFFAGQQNQKENRLVKQYSKLFLFGIILFHPFMQLLAQDSPVIGINGTHFTLDQEPFDFTGVSFFNALYNPTFNSSENTQLKWLEKFNSHGVTVIRIWAEWNNDLGFVDTCNSCTLYNKDGSLQKIYLDRLKALLSTTASLDMVIELALFSSESKNKKLSDKAADRAVKEITLALKPYRNIVFQIWNEYDYRTSDYFDIIKNQDAARLVSNSSGVGGIMGEDKENEMLDYLSPHTTRQGKHWEIAAEEIKGLIEKFDKPVVDNEPARAGTPESQKFGGPIRDTYPYDHILHIYNIWKVGGDVVYHHDMFQTGYEGDAIPPSGIPDPDFSPYHKNVYEFLKFKNRYE